MQYPAKIILAWGEAISGNKQIRDWLIKNGYPELGLFVFALYNQSEARDWLLDNGHQPLLAMIHAVEGKEEARKWLADHQFNILLRMALAADNDDGSSQWLIDNNMADFAVIALKIREVKNQIEYDNNDIHRISPD